MPVKSILNSRFDQKGHSFEIIIPKGHSGKKHVVSLEIQSMRLRNHVSSDCCFFLLFLNPICCSMFIHGEQHRIFPPGTLQSPILEKSCFNMTGNNIQTGTCTNANTKDQVHESTEQIKMTTEWQSTFLWRFYCFFYFLKTTRAISKLTTGSFYLYILKLLLTNQMYSLRMHLIKKLQILYLCLHIRFYHKVP